MDPKHYIYGLTDPFTTQIHYIGCTKNMESRLSTHISYGRREDSTNKKDAWVGYLLSKNTKPDMFMIQEVADIDKLETELFWIEYFKMVGADLLNTIGMNKKTRDEFTPKKTMVKPLRESLGLTQGQLAWKIKTTKKVINMWENNKDYFVCDKTVNLFINLYLKNEFHKKWMVS